MEVQMCVQIWHICSRFIIWRMYVQHMAWHLSVQNMGWHICVQITDICMHKLWEDVFSKCVNNIRLREHQVVIHTLRPRKTCTDVRVVCTLNLRGRKCWERLLSLKLISRRFVIGKGGKSLPSMQHPPPDRGSVVLPWFIWTACSRSFCSCAFVLKGWRSITWVKKRWWKKREAVKSYDCLI